MRRSEHQFDLPFPTDGARGVGGGIRILASSRPEPLFDHLIDRMQAKPLPPFEFETIILPHGSALRPWINQNLADRLGCAAGLYTPTIREYTDALIRRLLESEPSALDRDALTWHIFAALGDFPPDDAALAPVRDYLDRAGGNRMPLARRLAQLFDSYQTYRPEIVDRWKRGSLGSEAEAWQGRLWTKITEDDTSPATDRSALMTRLINHLSEETPPDLPSRITIFGESVVAPVHLRVLDALSRQVDIVWYALHESNDAPAHPLEEVLGEDARQAAALRTQHLPRASIEPLHVSAAADPTTALGVLQDDIQNYGLRTPDERVSISDDDASIRIHDCHSPIRELEVLRDQLLDAFESLNDLQPSDVLIAVPDLDRYAPLVAAVFSGGDERQRLPVSVARDPREEGRRYLTTFSALLEALTSRLAAGSILELLSEPAIGSRSGFDADAVEVVRGWIRTTHIRWGADGLHRQEFGLPENNLHTWRHGLDRLLMGLVAGETDDPIDGVIPLTEVTLDRAETLGRLAAWMQALTEAANDVRHPRPLEEWRDLLQGFVQRFLHAESDDEKMAEDHLMAELREMAAHTPDVEIDFASLRSHLGDVLDRFEGRGKLLSGAVTVADFERLRYIPARVIACVGLNDDAFPRSSSAADFDLIASARRTGDPDPRRLDKQLFLDVLRATRDRLILTYNGRSQRDNSERAPSIVIDTLLQTLTSTFTSGLEIRDDDARQVQRHFVVEHPLQPFSPNYFDGSDNRLFSYDRTNCIPPRQSLKRISAFASAPLLCDASADDPITLDDLIAAWSNPSKFFCQRLGLRLNLADLTVEDIEPQFFDSLETYSLNRRILELLLDGEPDDRVRERLRMEGALPAGALGRVTYDTKRADVDSLLTQVDRFGARHSVEVDIEIAGRRVVGRVPYVTDTASLHFRPAKIKPKDRLTAWIHHLALAAAAEQRPTRLIAKDETQTIEHVDEPLQYLEPLVERFDAILSEPMVLFPDSSMEFASKGKVTSAVKKYDSNPYNRTDSDDLYVSFLNRHHHPINDRQDDFEREAIALWAPIDAHLKKIK